MSWRYRRLWLSLGWIGVVTLVGVCLVQLPTTIDLGGGRDKLVHFASYFCLMAWFGQLYGRPSTRLWFGLGFAALGLAIEVAQGTTSWRSEDLVDAAANASGVLLALLLLLTPFQTWLRWFDHRLGEFLSAS